MRTHRIGRLVRLATGSAFVFALLAVGCVSTSASRRSQAGSTPQDVTARQQLDDMSHQDSEAAAAADHNRKRDRLHRSDRRRGQGVIDQPVGR